MISSSRAQAGAIALFVLLWGSAGIFTRIGLDHGSVMAMLILRFAIALPMVIMLGHFNGGWLPPKGQRLLPAISGLLMIGLYSFFYFETLAQEITPGLLATILGVQPILTLALTERRFSLSRVAGLALSLTGLILVVYQSLIVSRLSVAGLVFAIAALLSITVGTIVQKRQPVGALQGMPLQYSLSLLLFLVLSLGLGQEIRWDNTLGFWGPVVWLGLVISVLAQLLLYRMIRSGNLVNVTSLFYLVPVVTAGLDFLILGNTLAARAGLGLVAILAGLWLTLRKQAA
ncbi:DMT family transporter [Alcaligenes nematophilus]|uniref:DMT family transporter n=1 Tax=Alcaligenes sp. PF14 TaxID=3120297 RepID=UPI003015A16E